MTNKNELKINHSKIIPELLTSLKDGREREIIILRFGLGGQDPKTLEEIGKSFNITRERVRQIEKNTLTKIKKLNTDILSKTSKIIYKTIKEKGGIVTFEYLTKTFLRKEQKEKVHKNYLRFLLHLNKNLIQIHSDREIKNSWFSSDFKQPLIAPTLEHLISFLEKKKTITKVETLINHLKKLDFYTKNKYNLNDKTIKDILEISQKIIFTNKDRVGLSSWPEINPKSIKDKIYVVFKRARKPLHFTEITRAINKAQFSQRTVTTQAVHNELIKDKRFVLIGRGIYALTKWGYQPGTVAEIIKKVLKTTKKPLSLTEITEKVLKERQVKKSTIVLNLQEKKEFKRVGKATYTLNQTEFETQAKLGKK